MKFQVLGQFDESPFKHLSSAQFEIIDTYIIVILTCRIPAFRRLQLRAHSIWKKETSSPGLRVRDIQNWDGQILAMLFLSESDDEVSCTRSGSLRWCFLAQRNSQSHSAQENSSSVYNLTKINLNFFIRFALLVVFDFAFLFVRQVTEV